MGISEENLNKGKYIYKSWELNDYDNEIIKYFCDFFCFNETKVIYCLREYIKYTTDISEREKNNLLDIISERNTYVKYYKKIYHTVKGTTKELRKREVLRYWYECYKKNNYNIDILKDIANEYELSYNTIRVNVKKYIKDYLEISEKEKAKLLENINYTDIFFKYYQVKFANAFEHTKEERKDIIINYWYKYWEENNYDDNALKELAKEFDVKVDTIIAYLKKEFEKEKVIPEKVKRKLFRTVDSSNMYYKLYQNMYPHKEVPDSGKRKEIVIKSWYDRWKKSNFDLNVIEQISLETSTSVKVIVQHINKYINDNKVISKQEKQKLYDLLSYHNLPFYNIYKKKFSNVLNYTEEERKEIVIKYLYETFKESGYDNKKLEELSITFSLPINAILTYILMYIGNYLSLYYEEIPLILKSNNNLLKCYGILYPKEKIVSEDKMKHLVYKYYYEFCNRVKWETKEIDKLAKKLGTTTQYIKKKAKTYMIENNISPREVKVIEIENKTKETETLIEKKEEIDEKILISSSRSLILDFVNSEYDISDIYISNLNISKEDFEKKLMIVRKYDCDLYNEYLIKYAKIMGEDFKNILTNVWNICNYIRNGIILNNKLRTFNLLDYYFVTDISLENLDHFRRKYLSLQDSNILTIFINQYKKYKEYSDEQILRKIDKRISKEEKLEIVKYLKDNNVPINQVTFMLAIHSYINNNLYTYDKGIGNIKIKKKKYEHVD